MMKFPAPEKKKPKLAFSANISGAMGRLQEKEVKVSRQQEVVPAHQQLWELKRESWREIEPERFSNHLSMFKTDCLKSSYKSTLYLR